LHPAKLPNSKPFTGLLERVTAGFWGTLGFFEKNFENFLMH
jgi:hypothetical protein